jgi:hypothetical protein
MANDLVESVKVYLTPEVIEKINGLVGGSPSAIHKAMDGIVPSLISGVADLSASPEGAKRLTGILDQKNAAGLLHSFSTSLSGDEGMQNLMSSGRQILSTLFGARLNLVIAGIANGVGLNSASVSSLLIIAAPLVLAVLGREWGSEGLILAGVAHPFVSKQDGLAKLVPAGLAGLLPLGRETAREDSVSWWLWPTLGLLVVALLYFLWERGAALTPMWLAFVNTHSSRSS